MLGEGKLLNRVCVCVFIKPPRAGEVKTRLADGVGKNHAASLAQAFFEDTWNTLSGIGWIRPIIASTETLPTEDSREVWLQGEGDLGARLETILRRALQSSTAAIALGADSPGLPLRLLQSARSALATSDAVLGPCRDGGFYLIGLRKCPEGLLAGIPWSQPTTFSRTLGRLRQAGLKFGVLDWWFDVDTPADLARLRTLISSKSICAPRTAEVLAQVAELQHSFAAGERQ